MSPTSRTSRWLFRWATSRSWAAFGDSSFARPAASSPSEPWIEVSGVRSSWLTTEMNSSFIRSIFSCSSSRLRAASKSTEHRLDPLLAARR